MKEVQYVCRRLSLTLNEGVPYIKHDIYNMTSPSIECLMYQYLILQVAREVLHVLVEVKWRWRSVCSVGVGRLHSGAGPISPVCPRPPPTCYLIVTTIHSTSPISGFKLMNVSTFLWYTEPTNHFICAATSILYNFQTGCWQTWDQIYYVIRCFKCFMTG